MITDVVIGLSYGDEAKGKVTHHLLKSGEYDYCIRFNGGCNAGHTIYHNGVKFVTHHIPAGVFFDVKSVIGPGCVVRVDKLKEEIEMLEAGGINVRDNLRIAQNTHVITESHIQEDSKDEKIGTTKSGNGPAYRDKYARIGIRASDVPELAEYTIDFQELIRHCHNSTLLMEGAQGFYLDIDWGDYPYVTSSHCGTASALNGINPRSLRDVWGVAKIYETYVGKKKFQPNDRVFKDIQHAGDEFGATTGRPRQCNWLNIEKLRDAISINGVNKLVLNKTDVLEEVGQWQTISPNIEFKSKNDIEEYIDEQFHSIEVFFSGSPERI